MAKNKRRQNIRERPWGLIIVPRVLNEHYGTLNGNAFIRSFGEIVYNHVNNFGKSLKKKAIKIAKDF